MFTKYWGGGYKQLRPLHLTLWGGPSRRVAQVSCLWVKAMAFHSTNLDSTAAGTHQWRQ